MESHPTSKSTSAKVHVARALAILLLLGIIIATIVVVMRTKATYRTRHTTLPDGTMVELLGTSVGNTTFTTEKPWYRFARRWLPNRLQSRIPASLRGKGRSDTNSLTVWVRVNNKSRVGATFPGFNFQAEDEAGFVYPGGGQTLVSGRGMSMCGLNLRSYPRRKPSFVFDFIDAKGATVGSMRVPNPVHGPFSEWRPRPLPQSQTNGPVTLNLLELTAPSKQSLPFITPKWRVDSDDPGWRISSVHSVRFQDPTGNEGQFLSPREPAWKLLATVARIGLEHLPPGDRMTLTNVAIPAHGQLVSIDQSNTCSGVGIKVLLLAGAGELTITNGGGRAMKTSSSVGYSHSSSSGSIGSTESWNSPTPFFIVEEQNVQPDDEILVRVTDETGHTIKAEAYFYTTQPNGARISMYSFTPSKTAKFITLEILINRPLQFEFLVNPADIHPPKP